MCKSHPALMIMMGVGSYRCMLHFCHPSADQSCMSCTFGAGCAVFDCDEGQCLWSQHSVLCKTLACLRGVQAVHKLPCGFATLNILLEPIDRFMQHHHCLPEMPANLGCNLCRSMPCSLRGIQQVHSICNEDGTSPISGDWRVELQGDQAIKSLMCQMTAEVARALR